MTTLAAFVGGWELLLIAAVLGVLVGVPLLILAIVLLVVNRQEKTPPPISPTHARVSVQPTNS